MNQNSAIITPEQMAIEQVKRLVNIVVGLSNEVFKPGVDFGVIPGTGDKPTLLQPGMEKLLRALHLRAVYVERSKIEDFDKGLFFYRYECQLFDWETGECVGTAIGSANSYESKWRWREGKRKCPKCGAEAINRSKFPPRNQPNAEPGWYCYGKIGGCGSEFTANDPAIVAQKTGRVENPDIFDQMNTCDKIAQKRALGSAIKTVANVSMLYTVDLEDFAPYDTSNAVEGTYTVVKPNQTQNGHEPDSVPAAAPSAKVVGVAPRPTPPPVSVAEPNAPSAASDDPLVTFGLENGASNVITATDPREQESDDDPRLYRCDILIVNRSKGVKQYALAIVNSRKRIAPVNPELLKDLHVGDALVKDLDPGNHDLIPSWSVYAEFTDAWHIDRIVTGMGDGNV